MREVMQAGCGRTELLPGILRPREQGRACELPTRPGRMDRAAARGTELVPRARSLRKPRTKVGR